jgi:hypothetical protein
VFGPSPNSQEAQLANVGKALEDLETIATATAPIFLTVHEPRTSAQFVDLRGTPRPPDLPRTIGSMPAALLVGYTIRFGPAALGINGFLLVVAVGSFRT